MKYKEDIERTLVILKPDAIQRSLIGELIKRFENVGLKFIALKMLVAKKDIALKHYSVDSAWKTLTGKKILENRKSRGEDIDGLTAEELGQEILDKLARYMTAGPLVVCAVEGAHAVSLVRKIVGGTEPRTSDVGTIRGDYVLDSYIIADKDYRAVRNLIHASSSTLDAEKELNIWFSEDELLNYKTAQEHILYDVNFDNAKE